VKVLSYDRLLPEPDDLSLPSFRIPVTTSMTLRVVPRGGDVGRLDVFRSKVGAVTEFREVRIEGHSMLGEHVQLSTQRVQLSFDLFEFVVDFRVLFTQPIPRTFMMRVQFSDRFEL